MLNVLLTAVVIVAAYAVGKSAGRKEAEAEMQGRRRDAR